MPPLLSLDDVRTLKEDVLGGPEAARLWRSALTTLHNYAEASGCPAGEPVEAWFTRQGEAYCEALAQTLSERQAGLRQIAATDFDVPGLNLVEAPVTGRVDSADLRAAMRGSPDDAA